MRIILSPAKKMNTDPDTMAPAGFPVFLDQTRVILKWLREKTEEELQNLWGCNDKIAAQNVERLRHMDLERGLTPAVLSYEGIAYQYMAPAVFETAQYAYVQEHLRILSAFYGVLKPMDGVTPYRLEMQAKASVGDAKDLYEFWGKRFYDEVMDSSRIVINLASKEYSRCLEKYLQPGDTWITCNFVEEVNGKMVTKGTYAKMARGEMVRFMAEHQIEDPEDLKKFNHLSYRYRKELSDDRTYTFVREPDLKDEKNRLVEEMEQTEKKQVKSTQEQSKDFDQKLPDLVAEKKILRRKLKQKRKNLPESYRHQADIQISEHIKKLQLYRQAQRIFCYVSMAEEVDTRTLLEEMLADGKTVAVPLCREKGVMEARQITSMDQLKPGAYGIWEPVEDTRKLEPEVLELCVIPCVSCSPDGVRLGYGGGYYDRFLPKTKAKRVILCQEQMICEKIPAEFHDCSMDMVVTEMGVRKSVR